MQSELEIDFLRTNPLTNISSLPKLSRNPKIALIGNTSTEKTQLVKNLVYDINNFKKIDSCCIFSKT